MLTPEPTHGAHRVAYETVNRRRTAVVAGRLIVKLKPVDSAAALDAACGAICASVEGATVLRAPRATGRLVISVPFDTKLAATARELGKRPDVAYAEFDVLDRAQIVPNDTRYPTQWAPKKVNAEAAWDLETGKSNVIIGIVDSGLSLTADLPDHEDLKAPGRFVLGTDFVDGGTPRDLNGHGTHVTGIAAAAGNNNLGVAGMNWNSPVYVCRTLDAAGHGSGADFADAVEEITDYAVAHGLKAVINYSGGGATSQTKLDACQYASDHGMILCAATGNDNAGPVIFPAAYSATIAGVVAVGSTTETDTVSGFSNVGPEVTVVAPGSNILSTMPTYSLPDMSLNYGTLSGTSMATPLVTGLVALMWSRHPGFTNVKIKDCLTNTAVKLGSGTFNNNWGNGRVDAEQALRCGDLVLPKSIFVPGCPVSFLELCPSTLVVCRSKLPVLCPTSRLCPSKITICRSLFVTCSAICPSQFDPLCGGVASAIDPLCGGGGASAFDGCPSQFCPGGGNDPVVNPGDVTLPGGPPERRAGAEIWRSGSAPAMADADWFYVDDDGRIHGL